MTVPILVSAVCLLVFTLIFGASVAVRREKTMRRHIAKLEAQNRTLKQRLNGMSGFQEALFDHKTTGLRAQIADLQRKLHVKEVANRQLFKSLQRNGGRHEQKGSGVSVSA